MRFATLPLTLALVGAPRVGLSDEATRPRAETAEDSEQRLAWRWRRPGAIEYALSGALGGGAVAMELFLTQPEEPRWVKPVWFDTGVRDALRHSSSGTRERSSLISDYTGMGVQVWAYLDTTLVPLTSDSWNFDVAWQMTFINLQASALTVIGTRGIDRIAVRQRPDIEPCEKDPDYHDMCFTGATSSFPSGHTSFAFVGAGLVCSHHLNVPLYGNAYADAAACAVAASAAVSTGVLRLVADRHYATDVLAGAAIGASAGFVMPMFAHYWFVESTEPSDLVAGYTWLPIVTPSSFQLAFAARL